MKTSEKIIKTSNGKFRYKSVIYDSREEIYFRWFLDDILFCIKEVTYNVKKYNLFESLKSYYYNINLKEKKSFVLLREWSYRPDFIVEWDYDRLMKIKKNKLRNVFYKEGQEDLFVFKRDRQIFINKDNISIIDVKGGYSRYKDHQAFTLKQKMLAKIHGLYAQKMKVKQFFANSMCYPSRYRFCDATDSRRKISVFKSG